MSSTKEAYITAVRALDLLEFNGDLPDPEGSGDDFSFGLAIAGELDVQLRFDRPGSAFIIEMTDGRSEGTGLAERIAENLLALMHGLPAGRRLSIDGASRLCGSALLPAASRAEDLAGAIVELGELILALREAGSPEAAPFDQDLLVLR